MNNKKRITGSKIATIITGILTLVILPQVISRSPDPVGLMFLSLFGGATIALYLRIKQGALGWGQGIITWIGGAFVGYVLMMVTLQFWIGSPFSHVIPELFKGLLIGIPILWIGFRKLRRNKGETKGEK
jgi:hypothetical protein